MINAVNVDRLAQKSWWPLPKSWGTASNGFNLGYWSDQNEAWFQSRLQQIRAGQAGPLTITQWRRALQANKSSSRVRDHAEIVSRKALADYAQT